MQSISQKQAGTLHYRTCFHIGQKYSPSTSPNSSIAHGQIYVERLTPASVKQPFPLVMIHGYGMTGSQWLGPSDGGMDWISWFLNKGFEIYLTDQPSRGRSPHHPSLDGPLDISDTLVAQQRFTAPAKYNLWPSAKLHTQWPGSGIAGEDAHFDSLYASIMPSLRNAIKLSEKTRDAGVELLDAIGRPAILVAHSQGTQFGWLIADTRPTLVKAIVNLDPSGPPFYEASIHSPAGSDSELRKKFTPARPYGLTEIPITYSPPITSSSELSLEIVDDSSPYYIHVQQEAPARKLINLVNIPQLVVTAEASYHNTYDHCSVAYLKQAGVPVEHVKLEEAGIHGNGHMMFMEKNRLEILEKVIGPWLERVISHSG
ncbi:hypothetical protein D9757_000340 [Collybiopsis confluens]|uniref:AB hydrolase-1 domain-containing protein n=1 Tax=Collybiopsis confluens TaxID=2823264 RepID=A0A8H5MGK5_9AGAR|nr:hypothetical protein D9757_000340 [Collybiopsis confluens]